MSPKMIQTHQPTIFGTAITAGLSSSADGTMKRGLVSDEETFRNREVFLEKCGIRADQSVLVGIVYDKEDFTVYREVGVINQRQGMYGDDVLAADALVTTDPGVALFLPLADCVGVIVYDPDRRVLMVSHLGRHSIEQYGGMASIRYLVDTFGSDPTKLLVWLGPSPSQEKYPLRQFDGRGMHEVVIDQLMQVGVVCDHIEASSIDTATDSDYYSHSEFLKGNRSSDGRFAIVAMMTMAVQGEPAS